MFVLKREIFVCWYIPWTTLVYYMCVCPVLSHIWVFVTPWTVACQASSVHVFCQSRILEWVAFPFLWDLPNAEIKPICFALQADPPGGSGSKESVCMQEIQYIWIWIETHSVCVCVCVRARATQPEMSGCLGIWLQNGSPIVGPK